MVRILLTLILASCGLQNPIKSLVVTTQGLTIDTEASTGDIVGEVKINEDMNSCQLSVTKYTNLFNVSKKGHILLRVNNPPAGSYQEVISVECEQSPKTSKDVLIKITTYTPLIPTTPRFIQTGSVTGSGFGFNPNTIENCKDVAIDKTGNIFCLGTTSGSLFETSGGGNDIFLMKYSPDGIFQWGKQLGSVTGAAHSFSPSSNDNAVSLFIDDEDNLYAGGYTTSSLFEPNSANLDDIFIVKFDPNGNFLWGKQIGDTTAALNGYDTSSVDRCNAFYLDSAKNMYCAGSSYGSLFETNGGNHDLIIVKFDPSGNIVLAKQIGSVTGGIQGYNTSGGDFCWGMTVDHLGNIYCAGLTDASLFEANAGSNDIIVLKLNSLGNIVWERQLGTISGIGSGYNSSNYDMGRDIDVDGLGNIYIGGHTTSSLFETIVGNTDIFVFKMNSSGLLLWGKQLGSVTGAAEGFDTSSYDFFQGISVDNSGNAYVAGNTRGSLFETVGGSDDAFAMKLDTNGSILWARQIGATTSAAEGFSSTGYDVCNNSKVDSVGNFYCAGHTTSSLFETNGGSADSFIMKFDKDGNFN